MPTPVGPAPRDPDDPDFWDWGPPEERPPARRHPMVTLIAVLLIAALFLVLMVLSIL